MAWDALYEATPADATYVADTDDAIRSLKTDIRTRVAVEHGFNLSESSPQAGHGKHLRGSARIFVQSTDPTATSVTADDADYATGRVWLDSDDGRLKVYRGGAWNSGIAVSYADNAGTSAACSGNAATATSVLTYPAFGAVGAYALCQNLTGGILAGGESVNGSSLKYANLTATVTSSALSGTWQACSPALSNQVGLFRRTS